METQTLLVAARPRSFVAVRGPDAASYLQRMLSNDVESLAPGETCEALLLSPKGRLLAPLVVLRRSHDDYLLLTEQGLGEVVKGSLQRARFAARCAIEEEEHVSTLVLGALEGGVPNLDYGMPAVELLDEAPPADATPVADDELERRRIESRSPRWGRELDGRELPAEAGLDARAISFDKGCYPGQEPVARLHYRGRPNRELRLVELEGRELPPYDAELARSDGKVVGRVTSAVRDGDRVIGLAYVRREVSIDVELRVAGRAVVQRA